MLETELKEYFGSHEVPEKLLSLLKFENDIAQNDYFSDGFEFSLDKDKTGLRTYSENEQFLNSIIEFALADATGSTYGFWLCESNMDLNNAPIVAFGSEGGYHVVAKNIEQLLQILTFDCEPMIDWDEVDYYKDDENHEASKKFQFYIDWLSCELSLSPVSEVESIIEEAQQEYQEAFNNWVGRFYDDT